MAEEWYCKLGGQEIGPLAASQLKAMAAGGRLVPTDPVRQGKSGWVPAGMVKGLFAPAGAPASEAAPHPVQGPAPVPPVPSEPPVVPGPPAAQDQGAGDAFAFLNEVMATPPRTPSPHAVTPPPKITGPGKRKQQQKLFVMILLSLLGVLTVLLIVLAIIQGLRNPPGGVSSLDESARTQAKKSSDPENDPFKDSKRPPRLPPLSQIKWLDAQKEEWKVGDVSVKVASVEIMQPRLFKSSKAAGRTPDDYFVVKLKLTNTSGTKKVDYARWDGRIIIPKLSDNYSNNYKPQVFSTGILVENQPKVPTLRPEESAEEALVFEKPIEKAMFLRLELPGDAFKVKETGHFEIPIGMLVKIPPKGESPEGKKEPSSTEKGKAGPDGDEKASEAPKKPSAEGAKDLSKEVPDLDLKRQEDGPSQPKPEADDKGGSPFKVIDPATVKTPRKRDDSGLKKKP